MTDKLYTNWNAMSDQSLSDTIGAYIKHHRMEQNKTQEELAHAAGISRSTLSLLERGGIVTLNTFIQVLRVLDLLSIMDLFKVDKTPSPLALAKMEQERRQRVRSRKKNTDNKSNW